MGAALSRPASAERAGRALPPSARWLAAAAAAAAARAETIGEGAAVVGSAAAGASAALAPVAAEEDQEERRAELAKLLLAGAPSESERAHALADPEDWRARKYTVRLVKGKA
jgi:hypothetical protein